MRRHKVKAIRIKKRQLKPNTIQLVEASPSITSLIKKGVGLISLYSVWFKLTLFDSNSLDFVATHLFEKMNVNLYLDTTKQIDVLVAYYNM